MSTYQSNKTFWFLAEQPLSQVNNVIIYTLTKQCHGFFLGHFALSQVQGSHGSKPDSL